ncbi:MAG TPA: STAS domain-containing protein [Streptosporangiaceae bacterium]|jgi:anti-anti-sigma factor
MAWSRTAYRLVHQDLRDGTATLAFAGELDLTVVPALAQQLEQALAQQPRRLVLDLTEVTFVDVAAARLLAEATRLQPAAGPPVLRRPGPEARRILALTGFDALCEFDD